MKHTLISERVKEIRVNDLGLSQRELGLQLGVVKSNISMMENPESPKEVSKNFAIDLAKLSHVSLDYIFGLSNKKYREEQDEIDRLMGSVRGLNEEKQELVVDTIRKLLKLANG
ncbi:helix-turn-helix domain-containing protein [Bacillus thuringiensis]|uniref:helix-turn-helix domain-containing protein n=1 Tax=Bacillus thuringiensis TaxID=1428 RepID=UPI000BFE0EAB|nr:helix-turn-helix transcriptional regulator [Bacillus thuringiensis]PGT90125.1 hypothetical protein COD17_10270 [Bacillus thuringiensis]